MNIFEIINKLKEISKKVPSKTKVYYDDSSIDNKEMPIYGANYYDKLDLLNIYSIGKQAISISKLIKRLEELSSAYNLTNETKVVYEDSNTMDDVFINDIFVIDDTVVLI